MESLLHSSETAEQRLIAEHTERRQSAETNEQTVARLSARHSSITV